MSEERKVKLEIKGMTKLYDNGDGVQNINLTIYEGEIVNQCSSVTGPRRIPTAFVVLKEGGAHD